MRSSRNASYWKPWTSISKLRSAWWGRFRNDDARSTMAQSNRRGLVMGLSIAAALLVVAYQLHIWTHWYHDGVGLMNFAIYALFATVFSGTAAYAYLRSLESSWTRSQASDHS